VKEPPDGERLGA